MYRFHRDQRGQSLIIVLSLITILFLLGSALAVHASTALRATRANDTQGDNFYAADAATELGIWWQRNGKAGNPPAQTINGVTTSTTITTAGGGGGGSCPAGSPTVDWLSGLESGIFIRYINTFAPNTIPRPSDGLSPNGGWYDKQGDTVIVTSPVRTGNYALKVHNTTGSGGGAFAATRFATPYPTYAVLRFSTWFDTLPSVNTPVTLINTSGGTSNTQFVIYYDPSTQKWTAGWGSNGSYGVVQQSTVTATTGAWFSFDVRISANNQNPRTADWYVNDIAQTSVSATSSANATNVTTWDIGYWPFPSIQDATVYFDDIVVSRDPNDFPLGNIKVAPLVPNAMGTHNTPANFQNNDGTAINSTSYTRVDEIPNDQNATTDYIKQTASSATSYIELGFPDTTETCIRGASVVAGLRAVGTSANVAAVHSVANGFDYTQFSGDTSYTSPVWYTQNMVSQNATTPGTGPWTQAVINALTVRFGFSASATNRLPYLDSLLVEYGYRPLGGGGPATVTIVGTGAGSTVTTTYPDAGAVAPTLSTWTATQ